MRESCHPDAMIAQAGAHSYSIGKCTPLPVSNYRQRVLKVIQLHRENQKIVDTISQIHHKSKSCYLHTNGFQSPTLNSLNKKVPVMAQKTLQKSRSGLISNQLYFAPQESTFDKSLNNLFTKSRKQINADLPDCAPQQSKMPRLDRRRNIIT